MLLGLKWGIIQAHETLNSAQLIFRNPHSFLVYPPTFCSTPAISLAESQLDLLGAWNWPFCFLCLTLQLLILILSHFDQDTCGPGLSSRDIDLSSSYRPAVSHDLWPHGVKPAAVWAPLPPPAAPLLPGSYLCSSDGLLCVRDIHEILMSWKHHPALVLWISVIIFSSNGEPAGFL